MIKFVALVVYGALAFSGVVSFALHYQKPFIGLRMWWVLTRGIMCIPGILIVYVPIGSSINEVTQGDALGSIAFATMFSMLVAWAIVSETKEEEMEEEEVAK